MNINLNIQQDQPIQENMKENIQEEAQYLGDEQHVHINENNMLDYMARDYHYGRKCTSVYSTLPPTDITLTLEKEKIYQQHSILTVNKSVLPLKSIYSEVGLVIKKVKDAILKLEVGIRIKWSKDKQDSVVDRSQLNKSYVLDRKQVTIGAGEGYHQVQEVLKKKFKTWKSRAIKYGKNRKVRVYLRSTLGRNNNRRRNNNNNNNNNNIYNNNNKTFNRRQNKSKNYYNRNNNSNNYTNNRNYRWRKNRPFVTLINNDELVVYVMIKAISAANNINNNNLNNNSNKKQKVDTNTAVIASSNLFSKSIIEESSNDNNNKDNNNNNNNNSDTSNTSITNTNNIEDKVASNNYFKYINSNNEKRLLNQNLIKFVDPSQDTFSNTNLTMSMLSNIYYHY